MVSDTNHWFATWTSSVSKHLQEPVQNMLDEDSVPFPLRNWWFYRWGGSCAYRLDSESKQLWHNMKDSNPADSGVHAASCEGPHSSHMDSVFLWQLWRTEIWSYRQSLWFPLQAPVTGMWKPIFYAPLDSMDLKEGVYVWFIIKFSQTLAHQRNQKILYWTSEWNSFLTGMDREKGMT